MISPLARLDLDTAIRLRWALRDIKAKRTKLTPVNPDDLNTLIDMGLVEIRDDDDLVAMDALSQKYLGASFPRRRWSKRVVLVISPSLARYRKSPLRHQGANS